MRRRGHNTIVTVTETNGQVTEFCLPDEDEREQSAPAWDIAGRTFGIEPDDNPLDDAFSYDEDMPGTTIDEIATLFSDAMHRARKDTHP